MPARYFQSLRGGGTIPAHFFGRVTREGGVEPSSMPLPEPGETTAGAASAEPSGNEAGGGEAEMSDGDGPVNYLQCFIEETERGSSDLEALAGLGEAFELDLHDMAEAIAQSAEQLLEGGG